MNLFCKESKSKKMYFFFFLGGGGGGGMGGEGLVSEFFYKNPYLEK